MSTMETATPQSNKESRSYCLGAATSMPTKKEEHIDQSEEQEQVDFQTMNKIFSSNRRDEGTVIYYKVPPAPLQYK